MILLCLLSVLKINQETFITLDYMVYILAALLSSAAACVSTTDEQ